MKLPTGRILKTLTAFIFAISSLSVTAKMSLPETYAFQRGLEAMRDDKLEDAVDWFNKEISDNPDNGYTYYCLALIYRNNGENGKALQNANKALKKLPKKDKDAFAYTYTIRGDTYLAMEDTIRGLEDYAQAIKFNPENSDTFKERAQIYYEQGRYDLADADYHRMLSLDEANVVGHMGLGRNEVARKNYSNAVDLFSHVIKLASDYSSGYAFRAEAYIGLEKWNEAIEDIIQALDIDANEKARILARENIDDKHFPLLKARYKVMMTKEPNETMWPYLLAEALHNKEMYREAAHYYLEANRIDSWATNLEMVSRCFMELGEYQNALDNIERALQLEPERHYYLMVRSDILFEMGDFEGAFRDLDKYIEHYPDYWVGYDQRGRYKYNKGDNDGAIEDLTMSIILGNPFPSVYSMRGRAYKSQGMDEMAKEDFEKVLELVKNPEVDDQSAKYSYFFLGDSEKAKEIMSEELKSEKSKESYYYDAACLYSLMAENDAALDFLRKAFEEGYHNLEYVKIDKDLDNIRQLPEFNQLIEQYSNLSSEDALEDETPGQKETPNSDDDILEDESLIYVGEGNSPGSSGQGDKNQNENSSNKLVGNQSPATSTTTSISKGQISQVPFTKENGVTKVKCTINDLPLYFVFDTGASDVTLSMVEANFMVKNDYIKSTDVVGTQRYMDANGDVTEGTVLILRKVNFGGLELDNVRASVVRNQKAPLLLGQSVLGRLGRVEIDNVGQVINITR